MASKSAKKSKIPTMSPPAVVENDLFASIFRFCEQYLHGIKSSEIWKAPMTDRMRWTYFILPQPPADYRMVERYALGGKVYPKVDFEKFWFELSDFHKDRYLLICYTEIYRLESLTIEVFAGPLADEIKDLWIERISVILQFVRRYVMEKNMEHFRHGGALSMFVDRDSVSQSMWLRMKLATAHGLLSQRIESIPYLKNHPLKERFQHRLISMITTLINVIFKGFVNTYFVWLSYDAQILRDCVNGLKSAGAPIVEHWDGQSRLNDRIGFMRKLKSAAPRWSQADRRMILETIETDGYSCRREPFGHGSYLEVLFHEVGVEKFKKLVFGKQHFCAHCHRSSYTSEIRLLACKRCDTEGIRPRAWYCDRQCQKADWREHKASKHPMVEMSQPATIQVEMKKAGKKKRKSRKK